MKPYERGTASSEIGSVAPLKLGPVTPPRTDEARIAHARTPITPSPKQGVAEHSKDFDHQEVGRKLKQDYAHGARDASIRQLDTLHALIKYLIKADPNPTEMVEHTARLVYTQFNIKEVSVALRSPSDGLYRYVAEHGMRTDIWAAHRRIVYTYDDLNDPKKYKAVTISHHTKLYLAEDNPYGPDEGDTFSYHMMKQARRRTAVDSIEGDYLDIFIFGPQNETYGWIEISGTWDGKIPDARAIRCLEVVSSVLGIAISRHEEMGELADPGVVPDQPRKPGPVKK